jgi:hypothetical protein
MALIEMQMSGDKEVQTLIGRLGPGAVKIVIQSLRSVLKDAVSYARQQHLSGGSPTALHPRSGDLRNSFWYEVVPGSAAEVTARLGFIRGPSGGVQRQTNPLRYAFTHEFGATIRPVRGQYLRIPTNNVKTPAGRIKAAYNVDDARTIPNTIVRRSASGQLAIWEVSPGGRKLKALFWLVRQVTIPPRPVLKPTWARFRPRLLEAIQKGLAALGKGKGPA